MPYGNVLILTNSNRTKDAKTIMEKFNFDISNFKKEELEFVPELTYYEAFCDRTENTIDTLMEITNLKFKLIFKYNAEFFSKIFLLNNILEEDRKLSLEDWIKRKRGFDYNEETQEFGYWENPQGEWDWYFPANKESYFPVKKEFFIGLSKKQQKEIIFKLKQNLDEFNSRFLEEFKNNNKELKKNPVNCTKKETCYIEELDIEEEYEVQHITAVIDLDGFWNEINEPKNIYRDFIENLPSKTRLIVFGYHY